MKYKTARNLVCAIYTIAIIVLIIGITNSAVGSALRTGTIIAAVALILVGAYLRLNFCNCPSCGQHVDGKLLDTVKCPKCGAVLMPKKEKKAKKSK